LSSVVSETGRKEEVKDAKVLVRKMRLKAELIFCMLAVLYVETVSCSYLRSRRSESFEIFASQDDQDERPEYTNQVAVVMKLCKPENVPQFVHTYVRTVPKHF
jgi:hypothetical protein